MNYELITKEDLDQFRMQLLHDLRQMLKPSQGQFVKPWLKNAEVRKLLNISSNTIQRLRIAGKLPSSKVGGIHFYRYEDIQRLLNSNSG